MTQKIPPEIESKLIRLQELQEQLRMLILRRQQLESQLREVEHALEQVEKLGRDAEIYKTAGYVMFKTSKEQIVNELTDQKETLELRIKTVQKQENLVRKQFEELRKDISKALSMPDLGRGKE
ncbi:MAG: prefoldin subunit beta [Candidatus Methanomethylicota archaeon]|uniref:Prefoldin subunit beta n=1 Tax=Thermoproteota archaeon TaxID=2056631 RepID=A0A497F5X3_9CREN|nr:MAG: prefoldin subunit beta [Candidatus Verstraetearchaeota archaeon]RLE54806.1 MAG: prefoldin subunit beta [Candidatus Verstraetearchaeota archaeon]